MTELGLIDIVDGCLLDDAPLDSGDKLKFLETFRAKLTSAGFHIVDIGLLEMATKNLPSCPYFQLTITEGEEEYKSGNKLEYHSVITSAQVWIEHEGHECGHLAVLNAKQYSKYNTQVVIDLLTDLSAMCVSFIKRYLANVDC